jgi:hypothetical protein
VAAERLSALQLEQQVCLPACRAAVRSAGCGAPALLVAPARPVDRVQAVLPVLLQRAALSGVCLVLVRLLVAKLKDARRVAPMAVQELALVLHLVLHLVWRLALRLEPVQR